MNPDTLVILISGTAGIFIGILIGFSVAAGLASRAAIRAEKAAWAAANLFYSRKDNPA